MKEKTPKLAQAARELAEKKLQKEQQDVYKLSRHLEQLEARAAIYRHETLKVAAPPELPPPYALPPLMVDGEEATQDIVYPFFEHHPRLFNLYQQAARPISPDWLHSKLHDNLVKNTVLVIDNGGLTQTIEELSRIYHVLVWRLEESRQPLPDNVQAKYLPLIEFNYEECVEHLKPLNNIEAPLALIVVDGLIWQTPLFAAADLNIPVVLCFDRSITALPSPWLHSQWRTQQSFLWSLQIICVDTQTVDFFISQSWLSSSEHTVVAELKDRHTLWWQQQVPEWKKQYRQLLAQSQYLQKQSFDIEYFLGSESWRRENTLAQQMLHFLLAWRIQLYMRQLLPGFDMRSYAHHHPQLGNTNPLVDYIKRKRPAGPWAWQVIQPAASAVAPSSAGVALHIHAYYVDNLAGILQSLRCNRVQPHLYISVRNEADQLQAQQYCADYAAAVDIRIVPNRGRDIGAFLTEFGAELVENYDIIGHVHTKQSLFHSERDFISAWQDFLLVNVLGAPEQPMADAIVSAMQQDPKLGMVFADDPNLLDWGQNREYAQILMQYMGIDESILPTGSFKFPVGTMFWLRASVLKPLLQLQLGWEDYPAEPLAQDGSILHALERVFGLMPAVVGLETAVSYTPEISR